MGDVSDCVVLSGRAFEVVIALHELDLVAPREPLDQVVARVKHKKALLVAQAELE